MSDFSVWVFSKKDVRGDIRKKFPRDDGSGYDFLEREYDISFSRSTKKLAFALAEKIKKAFPKLCVDVMRHYPRHEILWRNGKIRGKKGKWVKP
jgi:hypothetical protein